jgi:hypothetical protein
VRLAGLDLPAATRAGLAQLTERGLAGDRPELDALARADRADELTAWLERRGIDDADELGTALTDAGIGLEELGVLDTVRDEDRAAVAAWVAWTTECAGLAAQVGEATGRLGELVAAMRTYSRLDEAAEQDVDLQRGLEDTLRILAPRLRAGITVRREYADGLPTVVGSPGALNQVWTHLIENAADAMAGRGVLQVATARQGDRAVVSITDDGPGIPADIRERIFEPFFTTKPVGQGGGARLDIVSRIVRAPPRRGPRALAAGRDPLRRPAATRSGSLRVSATSRMATAGGAALVLVPVRRIGTLLHPTGPGVPSRSAELLDAPDGVVPGHEGRTPAGRDCPGASAAADETPVCAGWAHRWSSSSGTPAR